MSKDTFSSLITRMPRCFDADRAADVAPLVAPLPNTLAQLAQNAASASPYLLGLIEREADWLEQVVDTPETAVQGVIDAISDPLQADLADALRQGKRRVALITALADLGGVWSLEQVTGALTDYADAACNAALRSSLSGYVRRGKLPGMTEDDLHDAAGMTVLAMGKMGARELNYSSDIDLICLFDETRFDPDDFYDARTVFVRATRGMSGLLSDLTAQGYVFRTDLRLRPDPAVTPVCMAMEAAERYYESVGRTWERAAYIKARPCAGDIAAGNRFLGELRPFVWRRHLDFAAIQDAHDMRLAIREHKGLGGPITLPGHNMKLGRGGIREIEFFTQTRQLIAGGRDEDLRVSGTVSGLSVLAEKDWIPPDVAETLADHYRAHRTVEHRLQMVRDAQTHNLPETDAEFDRIAAMMDMETDDLRRDLNERLSAVHELTERFFAGSTDIPAPPQETAHSFDMTVIDRWLSYPALRSDRGAALFEKLKPELLSRLALSAKPDEALLAFDGFLAGLPAGVQLFSLLTANPSLADLLIDVVTTSPALAAHLSRNAVVLDAVIGGDFFSDWPGTGELADMLREVMQAEADYETRLDAARRWRNEWHFRIGVHLLRGIVDAKTAGQHYAQLSRAVLQAIWPVVVDQFSQRHGRPPGRGAVILGMGSLGAGQLTPTSDLDLLVIYDPAGKDSSDGPRPLATRVYYSRLTQALITAMTAQMSQGRLYEVDMRLRPSGNKGPVATSLTSFESYQMNEAWVWEHLALTRASVVAGTPELAADVTVLCQQVLQRGSDKTKVLTDVAEMRNRIAAAKSPGGVWDTKIGAGRLQDIELLAQAGALIDASGAGDIVQGLRAVRDHGVTDQAGFDALKTAYETLWQIQCATRLISGDPVHSDSLGQAGSAFLCRVLQSESLDQAMERMTSLYTQAKDVISAALDNYIGESGLNDA